MILDVGIFDLHYITKLYPNYKCDNLYMYVHVYEYTYIYICLCVCIYIYIYIYVSVSVCIQGSLNKFPDFFCMGTFIDSTHMKL